MIRISRSFFEAVKLGDKPNYKIVQDVGIHPLLLSKILHGYERIRQNDARVLAVGRVLGLKPEEYFE